jgi:hypothetical protein
MFRGCEALLRKDWDGALGIKSRGGGAWARCGCETTIQHSTARRSTAVQTGVGLERPAPARARAVAGAYAPLVEGARAARRAGSRVSLVGGCPAAMTGHGMSASTRHGIPPISEALECTHTHSRH